jgi:uncharacterized repeat protein (TIGR01451 family)
MRRLNAIGTAIAGAALVAILAPTPASADPRQVIPGSVQAEQVVGAQADLSVRMSARPAGRVRLGDLLDYTIKVRNEGPAAAKNVKVAVALPAGLAVIGATPDGCAEQGGQAVICGFRSLASGASAEISVGTVVKGDASGDLRTTAKVSASTPDPSLADNEASATNSVAPGTDLAVKLAVPEQAGAGGLFTMRATVINHGPIKARNVRLGVGIERSTFVTLGADCSRQDQTHSRCDLGRLAPGDKMTLTFQARVGRTATGLLDDFAATVSADFGETHPDDNVAIARVEVLDSAVPSPPLLPATGSDSGSLGTFAVLLLGTGGLLLAAARPRRPTAPR